jgi:hypothetical protein
MKTPETKPEIDKPTAEVTPPVARALPCRYLRCKEMYYGAAEDDEFAGGAYWCERTQEPFGPDGETCSQKQCCANRTCYVT